MRPRSRLTLLLVAFVVARMAYGDAGVLIPADQEQPDPSVLSLDDMSIDVQIDNGDARVFVRQIYTSHRPNVLEGNYIFALPGRATVSDFAVWDGVTRIPGVILERRRAEEIYNSLKWQAIDPGLLQMGERGAEEARRTAVFSARIMPIPGFGTKRIEMEYHESLPVENLKSFFAVPLRPDAYHAQVAGHLSIHLELRSQHTLRNFEVRGKSYPLAISEPTAHLVTGTFDGRNVAFQEDLAVTYEFDESHTDSLQVLTYRSPRPTQPQPTETAPVRAPNGPGFFEASALFVAHGPRSGGGASDAATDSAPRTVIILLDTSLSMQWEKLDRGFGALEKLLRSLRPSDRFNLLLFNTDLNWFSQQPVAADKVTVESALTFVRRNSLLGGTNLERALDAALAQSAGRGDNQYIVLLSDGDATRGTINNGKLATWYADRWKALPQSERPRTYVFAVGDDANMPLLRLLGKDKGVVEWVRSTEPIDFKLNAFLDKIGRNPFAALRLITSPATNFDLIYPLEDTVFPGSLGSWVGQYKKPAPAAKFVVQGSRQGNALELSATVPLPAESLDHPNLPRLWAKARVDALLAQIEREGEDRASVDEIIRLARKFKFVTPYTSFLAVPRALLRPRVIRPGDPVIRVKTDPSIVSVVALFPFGLIKKLRYLHEEETWQTRFLAPPDMSDGTYRVRLILRDRVGHVYRESKSFVIASKPPVVSVKLDKKQFRQGELMQLRVSASEKTRTVVARLYGVPPVYLTWNPQVGSNTGELLLPADLPAGAYRLTVTAEDIAHNIGSEEVSVDVVP